MMSESGVDKEHLLYPVLILSDRLPRALVTQL